jgi:hypothetical protein
MIEPANVLENWIQSLLDKPIETLNEKYSNEEIVKGQLDLLLSSKAEEYFGNSIHVSGVIWEELHLKICDHHCEEAIWNAIFWHFTSPLPFDVAYDLIERNVAVRMMAMTRQADEI